MDSSQDPVYRLPDWTLLSVFSYLKASDIIRASGVCLRWSRAAKDEQLWKRRFRLDFHLRTADLPKMESWLGEYRRLVDECPRVPARRLCEHKEQVLHATFSRDGSMLATCSKDGTLKVWLTDGDWPLLHDKNLKQLLYWKYTLCARFNQCGRMLLVSGLRAGESAASAQNAIVGAGTIGSVGLGELAVFEFIKKELKADVPANTDAVDARLAPSDNDLVFRCRAINEPFDVYGCWYDDESILNGQSRRFNQTSTMSDMYFLHAAGEQTTSTRLFQFYNATGGVVRNLLVSSFIRSPSSPNDDLPVHTSDKDKLLIFTTGHRVDTPHQIGVKLVRNERITGPLEAAAKTLKMRSEKPNPALSAFRKIQEIKKIESPNSASVQDKTGLEKVAESESGHMSKPEREVVPEKPSTSIAVTTEKKEEPKISETEQAPQAAVQEAAAAADAQVSKANEEVEEETDEEEASPAQQVQIRVHTFDRVDALVETYGRIVGITLSPDQRYIFVHVRPFVDINLLHEAPADQPVPVHDHTEIRIIDLQTCTLLDDGFIGHDAEPQPASSQSPAFFVDVDTSQQYVLTGGEHSRAYLWDRRHRCLIRSLPHEQGRRVHSVAFSPRDSHVCVSTCEDGVTVWYSRAKERLERQEV